jgi:glycolate oxidase FAD binding subunit
MEMIAPADEAGVAAAIVAAAAARAPLAIEGRGTKRAMLRPVQAARTLSTRALTGITLYKPTELAISVRAGTPLPEIEAVLAEKGQALAPEPPDLSSLFRATEPATIGGIVATNLSGPRRIVAGAMRDHLLGVRFVNGAGEVLRSGGRVLKNVTGLDLAKLLAGSHGTLGVLTEVTLKVLPVSEATASLAVTVEGRAAGVRALSAGLGSPYGVTGAALLPDGRALLRLEDFAESVAYRLERLSEALAPYGAVARIEAEESRALWRAVRDAALLGATPQDAIWRVSVRPSKGAGVAAALEAAFGARLLMDWGGGLLWAAGPATEAAHAALVAATLAAGGSHTLFRAPDPLRAAVAVIPPEAPGLTAIAARVKAALDPAAILNPGRMRGGG